MLMKCSVKGGFECALSDAMLLGRPIVAPNAGSASELVQHGETGLLYDAGKAHQLASHLNYLLEHPTERYRLGVNARRLSRRLFGVNQMVAQTEQIYQALAEQKLPKRMIEFPVAEPVARAA